MYPVRVTALIMHRSPYALNAASRFHLPNLFDGPRHHASPRVRCGGMIGKHFR
jgi:hypothetical protein